MVYIFKHGYSKINTHMALYNYSNCIIYTCHDIGGYYWSYSVTADY